MKKRRGWGNQQPVFGNVLKPFVMFYLIWGLFLNTCNPIKACFVFKLCSSFVLELVFNFRPIVR